MSTTVIYSNADDVDTLLLKLIWKDIEDVKLIEINRFSKNYEDLVDNAIKSEKDTIIFCGHGTTNGLLFPDFYKEEYILHKNNVELINAKRVICIWCYASDFCKNNNIQNCFATSMFISNFDEAIENCIYDVKLSVINSDTEKFCKDLNYLIKNCNLSYFVDYIKSKMNKFDNVDKFNRSNVELLNVL